MKKQLIFIILGLAFFTSFINAQSSDKPHDNKKYSKQQITDTYSYYYNVYSENRRYGILKNDKKLLPDIFEKGYNYNSDIKTKIILSFNSLYGLFNLETETWDIPLKYSYLKNIGNGFYIAKSERKTGIVDDKNKIFFDFVFKDIQKLSFVENYFIVKNWSDKYGIINIISKKYSIPCEYSYLTKSNMPNTFKVKKDNKYNYADINNKLLFKHWYEKIYELTKGRKLYIVKKNNRTGIIDKNENVIVPFDYLNIETKAYNDGSHLAQNIDKLYGFIRPDGSISVPFKYTKIEKTGYGRKSILARNEDKCGILRINDGVPYEITTCDYDNVKSSENVFIISKKGKYGIIDLYGNKILDIIYEEINTVNTGRKTFYTLKKGYENYIADKNGNIINKTYYLEIFPYKNFNRYSKLNSYFIVKKQNEKYSVIDFFGKEILNQSFDKIISVDNNYIVFQDNNMVGIFDLYSNKTIVPAEYDQILYENKKYIAILNNEYYRLDLNNDKPVINKMKFEY